MVKIRSLVVWGNRPRPKKAPILHRIDMGIEEEHLYTMVGIGEKASTMLVCIKKKILFWKHNKNMEVHVEIAKRSHKKKRYVLKL